MKSLVLLVLCFSALSGCTSIEESEDRFSAEDRRWMANVEGLLAERDGWFARPDYEPKDAPYRTVMTWSKLTVRPDSVTVLLAEDRKSKRHFLIVWDVSHSRLWSSESLQVYRALLDRFDSRAVRLVTPAMEHYSSNQAMELTATRFAFTFSDD